MVTVVRYFLTVDDQVLRPGFLPDAILEFASEQLTKTTVPSSLEEVILEGTIEEVANETIIVGVIKKAWELANPGT